LVETQIPGNQSAWVDRVFAKKFVKQLVIARAIQGVAAAFLVPGSLSIISASFSEKERGRAIVLVGCSMCGARATYLNAVYRGNVRAQIDPGMLGAAFFMPWVQIPFRLVCMLTGERWGNNKRRTPFKTALYDAGIS
jgi:MFS family permease